MSIYLWRHAGESIQFKYWKIQHNISLNVATKICTSSNTVHSDCSTRSRTNSIDKGRRDVEGIPRVDNYRTLSNRYQSYSSLPSAIVQNDYS
jgi:hypothetical protein